MSKIVQYYIGLQLIKVFVNYERMCQKMNSEVVKCFGPVPVPNEPCRRWRGPQQTRQPAINHNRRQYYRCMDNKWRTGVDTVIAAIILFICQSYTFIIIDGSGGSFVGFGFGRQPVKSTTNPNSEDAQGCTVVLIFLLSTRFSSLMSVG